MFSGALIVLFALTAQQPGDTLELFPLEPDPDRPAPPPQVTRPAPQPLPPQPAPPQQTAPGEWIETPADGYQPPPVQPPINARNYEAGTIVFVTATSLALRNAPSRDGLLIHYIPQGTKLSILQDNRPPAVETIAGHDGQWVHVQHGAHSGYVFDAYVTTTPPALEQRLDWVAVPGVRVGPVNSNTTYHDLMETFGAPNLSEASIPVGEGETEPGTAIFINEPDKTLYVQWEIHNRKPKAVLVAGNRWKTNRGVSLGTRLDTLEEINGGPFSFAGFGWDHAGYITGWRGGRLEYDHTTQRDIRLYLVPRQPYLPDDYEALTGDKEFTSDEPAAKKLNLEVGQMTILLN